MVYSNNYFIWRRFSDAITFIEYVAASVCLWPWEILHFWKDIRNILTSDV